MSALTHGMGLVLSVLALSSLLTSVWDMNSLTHLSVLAIYGTAWVFLYLISTIYHLVRNPEQKSFLRKVDHSAIFLVMAATYTPFAVLALGDRLGWTILVTIWLLAAAGIAFKFLSSNPYGLHSIAIYMAMGWMAVFMLKPLLAVIGWQSMGLLLFGGVLYNVGIPFYLWEKLRYNHSIWHLFVISASACHHWVILRAFVW